MVPKLLMEVDILQYITSLNGIPLKEITSSKASTTNAVQMKYL